MSLTIAEFVWFVGFSFLCGMGLMAIVWLIWLHRN